MDNPIRYQDLIQPDSSIENAIKQLKELNATYDAYLDKIRSQASELSKQLQGMSGATAENQKNIAAAAKEAAQLEKLEAQAARERAKVELELQRVQTEKLRQEKLANQQRKQLNITTEEALELAKKEVHSIQEANEANKKLRQAVKQITDAEDKEGKIRAQLNSQIAQNTNYIRRNSDAIIRQKMNIGNYTESIKQAFYELRQGNNSMKNFGIIAGNTAKILGNQLAGGLREVGMGVGNMIKGFVGAQLVLKGINAFIGAVKEGINTIIDFQAANSKLAAILGTTSDKIRILREDALRLGAATSYTAAQVTELQTELAKLGFTQQEILQSTSSILKFASATGANLGEAAAVAGAAIRAFGADAGETGKYVATMAVATTKSALSFADLSTAISTAAPVAKAFGFTIEDLMTLIGALKNAGFDASSAATATRNIFLNLADANGKLAKALGQPIKSMDDMASAFAKLRDSGLDLASALELTDKRSVAAFESFLTQAESLTTLRASVTDVEKELYNMSETMTDNVAGSIKKMQSAWEGLMLTFSNSTGVMKDVVDFLAKGISNIAFGLKSVQEQNKQLENEAIALADQQMAEFKVISERLNALGDEYKNYIAAGVDAAEAEKLAKQKMIDELTAEIQKETELYEEERKKQLAIEEAYQNASFIKQALWLEKTNSQYEDAITKQGRQLARIAAMKYEAEAKLKAVMGAELTPTEKPTKTLSKPSKLDKGASKVDRTESINRKNNEITKQLYEAEYSIIKDGKEKERKAILSAYNTQIADLINKQNNDKDLTEESRENINQIILYKQQKLKQDLAALEEQAQLDDLGLQQKTLELKLSAIEKGTDEENKLRIQLLENARRQELLANSRLIDSQKQDEADINAKYDKQIQEQEQAHYQQQAMLLFDQQQQLSQSEFDLLKTTEEEKTRFKLQAERDRLKKILEVAQNGGKKLSDVEIKTIQNTIEKIDQEIQQSSKKGGTKDIYSLVGLKLDSDQKQAISDSVGFSIGQLQNILAAQVQLKEQALQNAREEVDAAQDKVSKEIEARNNGYSSDVETARKELELAKKKEQKALEEKKKAQKQQQALDSLTQTSSLITASANIWSSLSSIPIVGPALAAAAIATMWASFTAAKIKAREVTKQEEYGEGGYEVLEGGSHASGNDIDLGVQNSKGRRMRAEGGEGMAIINRKSTRKYARVLPGIVDSLNKGIFEEKYASAFMESGDVINLNNENNRVVDLANVENELVAIRKQGEIRYFQGADGSIIEIKGNVKRIIKN